MTAVASSVSDLATAFLSSGGEPTPKRRARAIRQIQDDGDLSENEQVMAMKLMRRDVTIADTFNAIGRKETRTLYLQSELEEGY